MQKSALKIGQIGKFVVFVDYKTGKKMTYVLLALAIITEVAATLLLKASNGWEKWPYGMGAIFFYSIAGMIFAFVLKSMNVGLAYAIWSGVGIALVCIASIFFWQQK